MNFKRIWWIGASLGLLLSAAGCSEVDHCKEGAKGCLAGECKSDDDCKFDLECVQTTGGEAVCGAKKGSKYDCGSAGDCSKPTTGGDGDGDGDMPEPIPCNCSGEFEICAPGTSDVCLNFCEDPGFPINDVDQRRRTLTLPCRDPKTDAALTFEETCKAYWRQSCLRSEAYCADFKCAADYHLSAEAQKFCEDNFADVDALAAECATLRDITSCDAFAGCTDPAFPKDCSKDFVCTNTCSDARDGACDDGDLPTALFGVCAWGSDCGDCGPRSGTPPPTAKKKIGELCVSDSQCEGFSRDLSRNKAWCLGVNTTGIFRCLADCSVTGVCSEGESCLTLTDGGSAIVENGITARVCDPIICQ